MSVTGDTGGADTAAGAPVAGVLLCPTCGAESVAGDQYCENCGSPLTPGSTDPGPAGVQPPAEPGGVLDDEKPTSDEGETATQPAGIEPLRPCLACGGTEFADGYCLTCGAPLVKERDHWQESPAAWIGAVSDRGVRHHRNEDAMALAAAPAQHGASAGPAVLVVCDGVSSSTDPDLASLAAARSARDALMVPSPVNASTAARVSYWTDRLTEAVQAADEQAIAVARNPSERPGERSRSPASCTFVAAVVDGPLVVVGWVGDSRAYWVPDSGATEMLTVDDSWAAEQIAAGMSREQAESAPKAHAITRWLGLDAPGSVPRCVSLTPAGAGWLVVCSDGLWNYCSAPATLGALVTTTAGGPDAEVAGAVLDRTPASIAARLVDWANARGGIDNITVAVARLEPEHRSPAPSSPAPDHA